MKTSSVPPRCGVDADMAGDFDATVAPLDQALIIVTTAYDGEIAGCLVGFHVQSSIEPPRYCVWLSKANHTYRVALRSSYLAVHFLRPEDRELARRFGTTSGEDTDKFSDVPFTAGPDGVPVIDHLPHRLVVRRVALLDEGGDHVCISTEPVATGTNGAYTPLRISAVADFVPGHEATERAEPPD